MAYKGGGINFDAKIRRNSTDAEDIFLAHIGGMDTFAKALIAADAIITESDYTKLRKERYNSFDGGNGAAFEQGSLSLTDIASIAKDQGDIIQKSGKQELLENIINQFC